MPPKIGIPKLYALAQLEPWSANPRTETEMEAIASIAESIRTRDLLQPLIGRLSPTQKKTHIQIVAGNTRLAALQLLREQKATDRRGQTYGPNYQIPVLVKRLSDRQALAVAIEENAKRRQMTSLDTAFSVEKLIGSGHSIAKAATITGLTKPEVAIALLVVKLPDAAINLHRTGARPYTWLTTLTQASAALRLRVATEASENAGAWPTSQSIRDGIKANRIPTAHALFDITKHKLCTETDLFDGTSFFSDNDQFWVLQEQEIQKIHNKLIEEGHSNVTIQRSDTFESWRYMEDANADIREAIIQVAEDGLVRVHLNLRPIKTSLSPPCITRSDVTARPYLPNRLEKMLDKATIKAAVEGLNTQPDQPLRVILAYLLHQIIKNPKPQPGMTSIGKLAADHDASSFAACLAQIKDPADLVNELAQAIVNTRDTKSLLSNVPFAHAVAKFSGKHASDHMTTDELSAVSAALRQTSDFTLLTTSKPEHQSDKTSSSDVDQRLALAD
jgi:ParB/RepB/Spo0J family partition protein